MDRRAQLLSMYGFELPEELFELWDWYQALPATARQAFEVDGGMRPRGVCDVLAGRFDDVALRYPAVLHWRYRLDPPELVTVLAGDTDGLHWGFWFDDPNQPPVIAGNYAHDSHQCWVAGTTLFEMIARQLARSIEACEDNLEHDPKHADRYRRAIAALRELETRLPHSKATREQRTATRTTSDGMGIVVPRASWDGVLAAEAIACDENAMSRCLGWIEDGKAGVALFHAKQMWVENHDLACRIMEHAYRALGREPLAAIAKAHREHPALPSVNILEYRRGHFTSLVEARATPAAVTKLVIGGEELTELPDLSALENLEVLQVSSNQLTTLPASLAACRALRSINAYRNQLSAFPPVLARLPALVELQLGRNQIAIIGDEIRDCRALAMLGLADNPITALPEAIGELPALRSLDLAGTRLEHVPESLGRCASLRFLALSRSPIRSLPADLSGWRDLQRIAVNTLPASEIDRVRAAAPGAEIVS
jgi:hypothetical protein